MELGGAAPRTVDLDQFAMRPRGVTAFQCANELVLRVSCISEAFAGGTASVSLESTSHPLPRAVYETILRDEAHHRRLGGLYFEWALPRIDDAEMRRLGRVLLAGLRGLAPFWKTPVSGSENALREDDDLRALGWLSLPQFGPVARHVAMRDIVDPLATIGITISEEDRSALFGSAPP